MKRQAYCLNFNNSQVTIQPAPDQTVQLILDCILKDWLVFKLEWTDQGYFATAQYALPVWACPRCELVNPPLWKWGSREQTFTPMGWLQVHTIRQRYQCRHCGLTFWEPVYFKTKVQTESDATDKDKRAMNCRRPCLTTNQSPSVTGRGGFGRVASGCRRLFSRMGVCLGYVIFQGIDNDPQCVRMASIRTDLQQLIDWGNISQIELAFEVTRPDLGAGR